MLQNSPSFGKLNLQKLICDLKERKQDFEVEYNIYDAELACEAEQNHGAFPTPEKHILLPYKKANDYIARVERKSTNPNLSQDNAHNIEKFLGSHDVKRIVPQKILSEIIRHTYYTEELFQDVVAG